jgi:hypothetical protein
MLPAPSRESKLVWFDGGAVVVPFPESEFPLSLADAEDPDPDAEDPDPDPEAVFDAVVFVPDCDLVSVPDADFPVADVDLAVVLAVVVAEVADAVFELLSCLLFIMTALFSEESGHGQACVSAEKDAIVARSCAGRILK